MDRALERRAEVLDAVAVAPSADGARAAVMQLLDIGPTAATAVLDMQFRRLASQERQKITDELAELLAYIRELEG